MGSAKGYLRDHGPMVAMLASHLGRELGLSKAECAKIFFAAVLSDMGMVGLAKDAWENPAPKYDTPGSREGGEASEALRAACSGYPAPPGSGPTPAPSPRVVGRQRIP
jgi:hypothetical protein